MFSHLCCYLVSNFLLLNKLDVIKKFVAYFYFFFQLGTLRFCGPTDFASGEWAGVELETPTGKNDGSVGGVHYFQCLPKHGKLTGTSSTSKKDANSESVPCLPVISSISGIPGEYREITMLTL